MFLLNRGLYRGLAWGLCAKMVVRRGKKKDKNGPKQVHWWLERPKQVRLRLLSAYNTSIFHIKLGFATVLDSELALDLVVHGFTFLVKEGRQQVDGGKEKHPPG